MRLKAAALLVLLLGPPLAWADPAMECGIDNGSQVEIGDCVASMEIRVDAALDLAFEFAAGSAKELDEVTGRDQAFPALEAAQSAWRAYREAQCNSVGAGFGGGSGTGIAISACRVELGRARIVELMRLVN